jgi:PAS domain S-box-containing protein
MSQPASLAEAPPAPSRGEAPILVIQDADASSPSLEAILEPLGHRQSRATSSAEASRQLLEHDFALILLDVTAERDGLQTARSIRSEERVRATPLIFVSAANMGPTHRLAAYTAGAVDYLVRPVEPDVLRAKVESFVDLYLRRGPGRELSDGRVASYRVLAESIPQQVWTASPDGALDYVNPVVLSYFAQSSEAILGAGWQSVIHADDLPGCVEQWTRSLTQGVDYEIEFRLRRHDGRYRWHLGRASPERGAQGRIIRWFGTNTDIDDRKYAEENARKLLAEESARAAAVEAEDRIRQIVESISDPMFILGADWRVEYVNAEGAQLLARQQSALLGQNLWESFPEAVGSKFESEYQRARREGISVSFEEYFSPLATWFEVRVYPTRDGRLCVHYRSIEARKQAEAKLVRESHHSALRADIGAALSRKQSLADMLRESAEALVRHLGAAFARIWTLNDTTDVLELQASAGMYTHLDGAHARVPVGKFKIGLIAVEMTPHLTNDVAHDPRVGDPEWAARTGMVAFAGYPLIVDQRCRGVIAMFSRAPIPADTIDAIAAVADAVAQGVERVRAEQALEQRAAELGRSNAELERFAYVASHDLQEPLRMVASYTQLLGRRYRGKLDASADEFIAFAVDGANRMQALINDLLAFSRVGTRRGELLLTSLEEPFAAALANLHTAISESAAVVTHDPLPALRIDPQQFVQLFQNLLGNAIKFRSDLPPVIHVGAVREGTSWRFSVQDNGIGIAGEFFERLFVLFQRLHTRTEYPGNGIGLAICKKIIERHAGQIWVESAPGAGTTFVFTLGGTE